MTRELYVDGKTHAAGPGDNDEFNELDPRGRQWEGYLDSDWAGDGQFAPFVIFDADAQENLPIGQMPQYYQARVEAEAAMAQIHKETA